MDVSVFIGNKRRFWSWILAPLLVRFILVGSVFGLTADPLLECEQERVSADLVRAVQAECDEHEKLLMSYVADPGFPVNEQLYQVVAKKNAEYGLALKAGVNLDKGSKAKVSLYKLAVNGAVPSVYVLSSWIDDMLSDPLLVLRECSYRLDRRGYKADADQSDWMELSCEFEKLALIQPNGGKK